MLRPAQGYQPGKCPQRPILSLLTSNQANQAHLLPLPAALGWSYPPPQPPAHVPSQVAPFLLSPAQHFTCPSWQPGEAHRALGALTRQEGVKPFPYQFRGEGPACRGPRCLAVEAFPQDHHHGQDLRRWAPPWGGHKPSQGHTGRANPRLLAAVTPDRASWDRTQHWTAPWRCEERQSGAWVGHRAPMGHAKKVHSG